MTISPTEKPYQSKTAFWQYHIENQSGSSLSQVRYCRDHSLALSTFQYWKRKLKIDGAQERARFYPLTVRAVQQTSRNASPSGVSLYLGNGAFRINLEESFSAVTLKELITVLAEL